MLRNRTLECGSNSILWNWVLTEHILPNKLFKIGEYTKIAWDRLITITNDNKKGLKGKTFPIGYIPYVSIIDVKYFQF